MSKVCVAINGFGRIGRLALKNLLSESVEVAAINDLTDTKTLCHLLKYDSAQGKFEGDISCDDRNLIVNGRAIPVYSERDPKLLPWDDLKVDVVLESTGRFVSQEQAGWHLAAGARKVVISAPAKGDVKTVVLGVNDDIIEPDDKILSNASCTTNCLAPMVKVLDDNFGVEQGYMTTIHAYTADQQLQDAPHKDLRRARAAAYSIIPTTTGAAKAVGLVLPHLKGKLDGSAMRVPIPAGSLTDLTILLTKDVTREAINTAMQSAAQTNLKDILVYETEPIVSIDIVGNKASCIFDSAMTSASGKLAKVVSWYDNEAGYAQRVVDLMVKIV